MPLMALKVKENSTLSGSQQVLIKKKSKNSCCLNGPFVLACCYEIFRSVINVLNFFPEKLSQWIETY